MNFDHYEATYEGKTLRVFRGGKGPAIIVMHEVPNLHPGVIDFGRRLVEAGFTVFMPSMFGTPGAPATPITNMRGMMHACVAKEFTTWATRTTSPIVSWLRALGRDAFKECASPAGKPYPGIGAVGMCLTGGFALAMMVDDIMLAPVLSQPSVPFPVTAAHRRDLGISDDDLACIKKRDVDVLGLRFTGDPVVPAARFERLREELGDRFIGIEIDSHRGNAHNIPRTAHSVLTHHLVDKPGHPTRDALDRVIAFYRERLYK